MAAPTPTSEYFRLTIDPFTANASPAEVGGQHCSASSFRLVNASNHWIGSTVKPISDASTKMSFACWIYLDAIGVSHSMVLSQRKQAGGGNYWYVGIDPSNQVTLIVQETNGASSFIRSISSTTIALETWTFIGGTLDIAARDVNVFKNGSEVSYTTQNGVDGTPEATFNGMATVGMGSHYGDSAPLTGVDMVVDRPKFGDNVIWTPTEMADLYTAEVAAIGTCELDPAAGGGEEDLLLLRG